MDTVLIIIAVIISAAISITICGLGIYAFIEGAKRNDWRAWHHFTSFVSSVIPYKNRQSQKDEFTKIHYSKKPTDDRSSNPERNFEDNRH